MVQKREDALMHDVSHPGMVARGRSVWVCPAHRPPPGKTNPTFRVVRDGSFAFGCLTKPMVIWIIQARSCRKFPSGRSAGHARKNEPKDAAPGMTKRSQWDTRGSGQGRAGPRAGDPQ